MVLGTVALDPDEVTSWSLRISDREIYSKAGATDLVHDFVTFGTQRLRDRLLEGRFWVEQRMTILRQLMCVCVLQEGPKRAHTERRSFVYGKLFCAKVGKEHTMLPSSCEEHIQATLAAFEIDGTKKLAKAPVRVESVPHTHIDHVPLVTLDRLKILDEETFRVLAIEVLIQVRSAPSPEFDLLQDCLLLLHAECSDTKTVLRHRIVVFDDCVCYRSCFPSIHATSASVVGSLLQAT